MHIALVGCGFVGSTYLNALEDAHEIYVIDPSLNTNRVDDYVFDGIILCLPTPANNDITYDTHMAFIYPPFSDRCGSAAAVWLRPATSRGCWLSLTLSLLVLLFASPRLLGTRATDPEWEEPGSPSNARRTQQQPNSSS